MDHDSCWGGFYTYDLTPPPPGALSQSHVAPCRHSWQQASVCVGASLDSPAEIYYLSMPQHSQVKVQSSLVTADALLYNNSVALEMHVRTPLIVRHISDYQHG